MENKINIAELLKDCPKGMELYSPIFGKVYLDKIRPHLAIVVTIDKEQGDFKEEFLYDGRYVINGECMLFPSKGKTTWEGFQKPWTIQDAKDGDVIICEDGWTCIFKCIHGIEFSSYCFITRDGEFHTAYETHSVNYIINGKAHLATKEQSNLLFQKIKEAGYKWNLETKNLEKLPKFNVGDRIQPIGSDKHYIIKNIKNDRYILNDDKFLKFTDEHNFELVPNKLVEPYFKVGDKIKRIKTGNIYEIIKILSNYYITKYLGSDIMISWADQDQYELVPKFKVGDKIRCKADPIFVFTITNITKDKYECGKSFVLRFTNQDDYELVPNKFDTNTLKPFDKVLVRTDNKHIWSIQFFERINNILKDSFVCMGGVRYHQCIPYEGNEHLLNTSNDCDNFFKVWKES